MNIKNGSEKKLQNIMKPRSSIKSEMNKKEDPKIFTLGDFYALKLDTLEWIKIECSVESKIARANHCMAKLDDESLIIFGGNAVNSLYCNKDYLITFTSGKIVTRRSSMDSFIVKV